MIAWNSRRFMENNYLLLVGIASLFVGIIGVFHTLAYQGMPIFKGYGTDLATQLWVSARYLQSFSLLIAPFFLHRRLRPRLTFAIYLGVFLILLLSIFAWDIFPTCFEEGEGLTSFKIISEYVISMIFLLAMAALIWQKDHFDRWVLYLLSASILFMVAAEFLFTLYMHPYGASNLVGHVFMIFSFYFLYRALIHTGLRNPYNLLFRNLKLSEGALRESEARYRLLSEHLEEKVEEKVNELKLAQRLASIGQMVSVVAHEVRNPLQNISMGIDALRKEVGDHRELAQILEEIDYGISSLTSIISELLEYSRPTQLNTTTWHIAEIIERALRALAEKFKGIEVHIDLEQDQMVVPLDAPKMIRVLVNLLSNSAEAMSGQGSIWITSRFSLHDGKSFLNLSIRDNGPGISPQDLDRIFEPFFTTKARGTGLGIPICQKIIEAHHGTIRFQSALQEGTTVEIVLPAVVN